MTTTEPLQVLVAESDLSDPALALGLIKKGHTCKAFECNADDPHKIGYYLHLTSSAALRGGDSSRDLRSRCRFAVHRPGNPEASPRSHGMPCRSFTPPGGAGVRLVLADSLKVSYRTDILGEVERRFLPGLKVGVSASQSR